MAEGDDQTWVPAKIAVDLLAPIFELRSARQEALIDRLAAGLISTTVSLILLEYANKENNSSHENQSIFKGFWERFRNMPSRNVERWETGDFTCIVHVSHHEHYLIRLFGASFLENDVLRMLPSVAQIDQRSIASPSATAPLSAPSPNVKPSPLKPASTTDLERIARIYHEFAGSSGTDDEAHRVAVAVFPKHHVARDRFRVIYSGIRGYKSRGRSKG